MPRMVINYQPRLCQDKAAKILVNQIGTQCKLVLLGMLQNSNQQQWPNKQLRVKIQEQTEKKSSMALIS